VKPHPLLLLLFATASCTPYQKPEAGPESVHAAECVILLHGLIRTPRSMSELEDALTEAGYLTFNEGYPSRDADVDALADMAIEPALANCREQGAARISFVTHSLGGILVRYNLAENDLAEPGRIVMLAPPNDGSEIVDSLRGVPGVAWFYGPAFLQLGTDESSVLRQLGRPDFEVGIIAGQSTGMLSGMLPGNDDGTVSVESARLEGAADFLVVDAGHTFIMNNNSVVYQALFFLENGYFDAGITADPTDLVSE
jgi:triacylglycerol lipase